MTQSKDTQPDALLTEFGLPRISGGEFQPGEGGEKGQGGNEGGGGEAQGFVESYLQQVPDDYRDHVEPYIREVERNTNKRFQDHAEYRKQWEPYEELGLNEVDPEAVQQLLEFAELASDEDQFKEWLRNAAEELDLFEGDEDDDEDVWDEDNPDDVIDQSSIQQAISEQLNEALTPILERQREEDMQREVDRANQHIDTEIESLKEEFGDFDEQAVYRFALAYDGPDAIKEGFQDYQDMLASIENQTLSRKNGQPMAPEGEGRPNTTAKPVTNFNEAKELARERFAHDR